MQFRPRLALATPSNCSEPAIASLAMMAALKSRGTTVQHFRSRACLTASGIVGQVTGLPGRHLDAWLMPRQTIREVYVRGALHADFGIVEGTLEDVGHKVEWGSRMANRYEGYDRPGGLAPIAAALDLPCVAVVDISREDDVHFPKLHPQVDAILIDGVVDRSRYDSIRRFVESVLKKPVIGAVDVMPQLRTAIRDAPVDQPMPPEWFEVLGSSFNRFADWETINNLAESRPFPDCSLSESQLLPIFRPFKLGYAQDEVFGGYFPDTLEMLEILGAEMIPFSPLRDEDIPKNVDLIMIGCGVPDHHIDAITSNHSLMNALRLHVCKGRKLYSEGGGTAYLSRIMKVNGKEYPGVGIFPFTADLRKDPGPPIPVERTTTRDGWLLGPKGMGMRGYKSQRWKHIPFPEPDDDPAFAGTLTVEGDVFYRKNAVGGMLHLHLGAFPEVVAAFANPPARSLSPH
jgi:cobyrinic acid a,c-diamide synthase